MCVCAHACMIARPCLCVCAGMCNRNEQVKRFKLSDVRFIDMSTGKRSPVGNKFVDDVRVLINGPARNGVHGASFGGSWRIPAAQLDIYS